MTIFLYATQKHPKVPIVVIQPSPIWEQGMKDAYGHYHDFVLDRSNEVARDYGFIAEKVAKQWGLTTIDAWSALDGASEKRRAHFNDGVHFTPSGNHALFEAVQQHIQHNFPAWLPETLHMEDPFQDIVCNK